MKSNPFLVILLTLTPLLTLGYRQCYTCNMHDTSGKTCKAFHKANETEKMLNFSTICPPTARGCMYYTLAQFTEDEEYPPKRTHLEDMLDCYYPDEDVDFKYIIKKQSQKTKSKMRDFIEMNSCTRGNSDYFTIRCVCNNKEFCADGIFPDLFPIEGGSGRIIGKGMGVMLGVGFVVLASIAIFEGILN